jgi:hypothetical protein
MSLPVTVRPSEPENPAILVVVTLALAVTIMVLLISGCGVVSSQFANPTASTTSQSISGQVHGGNQFVTGSHIYVFAAGTSGYGGPSVSLINPSFAGVSTDSYGAYVTSDSNGNFSLTGAYNCSPGKQVYLLARGGNPGLPSGTSNPAISLISPLGTCPNSGTFAGSVPALNIDEVSTVAAVYALAGFMTDAIHVSSSASTLAQQGVANAFLSTNNLVNIGYGLAVQASIAGNGVPPQATINTLANLLSACVNSAGASTPSSAPCPTLFANAKDSSGNLPSDTTSAMVNIAHNPSANVLALYNLAVPAAPFQPTLPAAPNDWTIAITYYFDAMAGPYYPAFDASGNLWVPAYANNILTEIDPRGIPISGQTGFSGNSLNQPYAIAIDSGQSAWVANYAYGKSANVSRFSPNGSANGNFPCGINCTAVAIDSLQNIWVAGSTGVYTMHNSGLPISQFSTSGSAPSLAIDSTGHGWSLGTSRNLYKLTLPNVVTPYSEAVSSTLANDLTQFAIDSSDNVWFTSGKNNALGRVDSSGNLVSPPSGYTGGGLTYPAQLAVDGSNRVWVANRDGNSISVFSNSGTPISPTTGYQPSGQVAPDPSTDPTNVGVRSPHGLAIDASGNVWVTNFTANSVTEFFGLGTPVVTPISAATHGQRP